MLRILFILLLALVVYALVDCIRNDDVENPVALPKALWVVLIIVFPGAGALAWLLVSRASRQTQRAAGRGSAVPRPPVPGRPSPRRPVVRQVAPDDDPEFLASLNRRAEQERAQQQEETAADEQRDEGDDAEGPHGGTSSSSDEDGGPAPRR